MGASLLLSLVPGQQLFGISAATLGASDFGDYYIENCLFCCNLGFVIFICVNAAQIVSNIKAGTSYITQIK